MFLHLGADVVVGINRIISILDLRTAGRSEATREFLQLCRSQNRILEIAEGTPKSIVVTDREVYLSPISSLTLKKRSHIRYIGSLVET